MLEQAEENDRKKHKWEKEMAKRNKKLAKRGLPPVTAEYDPTKPKPTLDELKAMLKDDFEKGLCCRMSRDKEALRRKREGKLKLRCRVVGHVELNAELDPFIVRHTTNFHNKLASKNKDNHFCVETYWTMK